MEFWQNLPFDNVAQKECGLSLDHNVQLEEDEVAACFSAVDSLIPLQSASLLVSSSSGLAELGADEAILADLGAEELCGNTLPAGARLAAHCYCGHQNGHFAGLLGDGAAVSLGEVLVPGGHVELNLEGCGITPFTRLDVGTGRKSLSQAVKEMLVSEALAALDVPVTRSLAVVKGMDISNKSEPFTCGTVLRSSPSFLRFGSFQVALPTDPSSGRTAPFAKQPTVLKQLALHCISRFFPDLLLTPLEVGETDPDLAVAPRFIAFLLEVVRRTARLVAAWQCLGAVHGMLNTDNMSILGLSLDHGCFQFMEETNPSFGGIGPPEMRARYCYREQPGAALWACQRLAEALQPLHCCGTLEMAAQVDTTFHTTFDGAFADGMRSKLGLKCEDRPLVERLLALMERTGADWTRTFYALSADPPPEACEEISCWCREQGAFTRAEWADWLSQYSRVLEEQSVTTSERRAAMLKKNPVVVPRGWLVDKACRAAEQGDYEEVKRLFQVLVEPLSMPKDPAEALPKNKTTELEPVDPTRLGPEGVRVASFLDNVSYWRNLCPELSLLQPESAEACAAGFEIEETRLASLKRILEHDGVCTTGPSELPMEAEFDFTALANCTEKLVSEGWPPSFIYIYDEAWIMAAKFRTLMKQLTGNDTCFDVLAFRVTAGQSGFSPHRDRPLGGLHGKPDAPASAGFHADGAPKYLTAWVPLVDVPASSSCLMCVPAYLDPFYTDANPGMNNPIQGLEDLQRAKALPCPRGGALFFSHRLFHWGRTGDRINSDGGKGLLRLALSFVAADDDFESPRMSRKWLPLPPLQIRLSLAAAQTLAYGFRNDYGKDMMQLCWGMFSASADHFDPGFACEVYKAVASIGLQVEDNKQQQSEPSEQEKLRKRHGKVRKEAFSKGVELKGASEMGGLSFFCVNAGSPHGDFEFMSDFMDILKLETQNRLGIMTVSAATDNVSLLAYVPESNQANVNAGMWMESALATLTGEPICLSVTENTARGLVPLGSQSAEELKRKCIESATEFLKSKHLFPDHDESDGSSTVCFGDDDCF